MTSAESAIVNFGYPGGNNDFACTGSPREQYGFPNQRSSQSGTSAECAISDFRYTGRKGDRLQSGTSAECASLDFHYAGGNSEGRQTGTVLKCEDPDFRQTGRKFDRCQSVTARKGFFSDFRQIGGELDRGQSGTAGKCVIFDHFDAVGHSDRLQILFLIKLVISNTYGICRYFSVLCHPILFPYFFRLLFISDRSSPTVPGAAMVDAQCAIT